MQGVLKLAWNDGYEGTVDLRVIITRGRVFEPNCNPERFRQVRVERYGHHVTDTISTGATMNSRRLTLVATASACSPRSKPQ